MTLEEFKAKLAEVVARGSARSGDLEFLERLSRIEAAIAEDAKLEAERKASIRAAKEVIKHWSET